MNRRSSLVYGVLGALWALLIVWQSFEHVRVHQSAQRELIDRGHYIASTAGRIITARVFGPVDVQRMEAVLNRLMHQTNEVEPKIESIALLNAQGSNLVQVIQPGVQFDMPTPDQFQENAYWGDHHLILEVPFDLGITNLPNGPAGTNSITNIPSLVVVSGSDTNLTRPREGTNGMVGVRTDTNGPGPNGPRFRGRNRPFFLGQPSWLTKEQWDDLKQRVGVHAFVLVIPSDSVAEADRQDLWIRAIIGLFGALGATGYAFAWRSRAKSTELQLRLVRASELNTHLKEMNLAAAGLAHETRNPLNIIRGLAHLVAKQPSAPPEIREKSNDIINQADRVAAQLNEFINYSRPREVRRAAVNLTAVVNEVTRTLAYDLEEKKVQIETQVEPIIIEADEQLLRQVLFNLALNAIQAVPAGGTVRIRASRRTGAEGFIEVSDNGPGVPLENRSEIFRPYFTTNQEGTGLGLSIVQQIVLAHGWDIECLPNEPKGALFRISHLKLKG